MEIIQIKILEKLDLKSSFRKTTDLGGYNAKEKEKLHTFFSSVRHHSLLCDIA
jgi:hypothetical protein